MPVSIFVWSASFTLSYDATSFLLFLLNCFFDSFFENPWSFFLFAPFSLCNAKSIGIKEEPSQNPITFNLNPSKYLLLTWSHILLIFSISLPDFSKKLSSIIKHLVLLLSLALAFTILTNFITKSHKIERQSIKGLFFKR